MDIMNNGIINPNNIKAFEWKELSDITQRLEKLKLEQWVVMETPPEVYDILGKLYNDDAIVIKSIEMLSPKIFELWFIFPPYTLAKKWLEHVSGVQMTVARFQSLYTAIGLAIKTWAITTTISYEIFLMNMYNVLDRETNIINNKLCLPNEQTYLQVEVGDIIKKWNFYMIECKFLKSARTFLHWSQKCVLEDRFLNNA